MCPKNYDQMMYGSWDMVCNRWTEADGPTEWTDGWTDRQTVGQTDGKNDI